MQYLASYVLSKLSQIDSANFSPIIYLMPVKSKFLPLLIRFSSSYVVLFLVSLLCSGGGRIWFRIFMRIISFPCTLTKHTCLVLIIYPYFLLFLLPRAWSHHFLRCKLVTFVSTYFLCCNGIFMKPIRYYFFYFDFFSIQFIMDINTSNMYSLYALLLVPRRINTKKI